MVERMRGVPSEFHSVTPYLVLSDADSAIEFYRKAFGAWVLLRVEDEGRVRHAEIMIGNSPIMLTDEKPDNRLSRSPLSMGGSPARMFLYVEDVDTVFQQAIAAGAEILVPIQDVPDEAERRGGVVDPFGYIWWVATQIEDISREELQARFGGHPD